MHALGKSPTPQRGDADLEQRVHRDLAFLFEVHEAIVTSNTLQAFGNSKVTIAVGNLEFQFAKNQRDNDFRISVSPRDGHGVWELLHIALAASTGEDPVALTFPISYRDDPIRLSYIGFTRLASVLKPRFECLNEAFSSENYPATHARMVQIERRVHPK